MLSICHPSPLCSTVMGTHRKCLPFINHPFVRVSQAPTVLIQGGSAMSAHYQSSFCPSVTSHDIDNLSNLRQETFWCEWHDFAWSYFCQDVFTFWALKGEPSKLSTNGLHRCVQLFGGYLHTKYEAPGVMGKPLKRQKRRDATRKFFGWELWKLSTMNIFVHLRTDCNILRKILASVLHVII